MSADPLWDDYYRYDRCVDIVSIAEVWFTRSAGLPATVRHFERFPKLGHPDGNPATPDFTVLFNDGTAVAAELANLALVQESLDSLAAQLLRYDQLTEISSGRAAGGQTLAEPVTELDVLLFAPVEVANAACDRLQGAIDDAGHLYKPRRAPMVLGYSLDAGTQTYTFVRPTRALNDLLPDYGRSPSLSSWLRGGSDTLRGMPGQFAPIKAQARFMNDDPPPLYTATVMWGTLLPSYIAETGQDIPVDLNFTLEQLTGRMRQDYGFGRRRDVAAALEFLKTARLAEETGTGWVIYFRDLGSIERDISRALLHEFRSMSNKARPVRTARPIKETPAGEEPTQERLIAE
ncbi:MAG TPA: hypothetical protein VHC01_03040 [Gaiellaceae bacterium]|jgi:hypothetical protein|nr:hypothetical protein [Gaiellaceae bacterium]